MSSRPRIFSELFLFILWQFWKSQMCLIYLCLTLWNDRIFNQLPYFNSTRAEWLITRHLSPEVFMCSLIIHPVTWLKRNVTRTGRELLRLVLKVTRTLSTLPSLDWHLCLSHPLITLRYGVALYIYLIHPPNPCLLSYLVSYMEFCGNWKPSQQGQDTKSSKHLQLLLFRA